MIYLPIKSKEKKMECEVAFANSPPLSLPSLDKTKKMKIKDQESCPGFLQI